MGNSIDSHCHVSTRWYEPVETLLFQMDRNHVERAVLIQLLGGSDNGAMRDAQSSNPERFAWVAGIDPTAAHWREDLDRLVDAGAAGLRLRADWRSPGEDPFALWREAERAGLCISVAGRADEFTNGNLLAVADACPKLPLVLEHLGGLGRPDVGDVQAAAGAICMLASHLNVRLKLPGLGQLAPRLPSPDAADCPLDLRGVDELIERVIGAFGPDRLMWGSDFPPVAAREGYANALGWCRDFIAQRWPAGSDAIFRGNAAKLWFGS